MDTDRACELWRSGMNTADIASELLVSEAAVTAAVCNPARPILSRRGKNYTAAELLQLKALFDKGANAFDAAAATGRTPWGVAELAQRHLWGNKWVANVQGWGLGKPKRSGGDRRSAKFRGVPAPIVRTELDDIAFVRVTDTLQGCGREVRNVAFYRTREDIEPLAPFMGCDPVSRIVETRKSHGGGFLSKWVANG